MIYWITLIIATIIGWIGTAVVRNLATRYSIGTYPDNRKIHVGFMPIMGGLGIFAGALGGLILLLLAKRYYVQMVSFKYLSILIASSLMLLVGIYDDLKGMNSAQKFLFQLIASTIVIFLCC